MRHRTKLTLAWAAAKLALAGTLVRPDDDVDDSREYTLVPLPE